MPYVREVSLGGPLYYISNVLIWLGDRPTRWFAHVRSMILQVFAWSFQNSNVVYVCEHGIIKQIYTLVAPSRVELPFDEFISLGA